MLSKNMVLPMHIGESYGGLEVVSRGARWSIGNGKLVCFWSVVWVDDKPLMNYTNSQLIEEELQLPVCDFVNADGT